MALSMRALVMLHHYQVSLRGQWASVTCTNFRYFLIQCDPKLLKMRNTWKSIHTLNNSGKTMYLSYPTFQKMYFYEKNSWTDLEIQAIFYFLPTHISSHYFTTVCLHYQPYWIFFKWLLVVKVFINTPSPARDCPAMARIFSYSTIDITISIYFYSHIVRQYLHGSWEFLVLGVGDTWLFNTLVLSSITPHRDTHVEVSFSAFAHALQQSAVWRCPSLTVWFVQG